MIEIIGANASPFVRKVRVALAEKGIPYTLTPFMPFNVSDEFKKISPLGKIPVLKDGDYTLPDSSCVIAYLERVHPTPALYPADAKLYGRALFYEEYGDTKLIETLGPIFFERVVKVAILKQKPDEARVKGALEQLPAVFDWLETQAPASGDAIVGGRFSNADIALASPIVNLEHGGERIDAKRWPKLAGYVARVHARPSFKTCIEEERKGFGG